MRVEKSGILVAIFDQLIQSFLLFFVLLHLRLVDRVY